MLNVLLLGVLPLRITARRDAGPAGRDQMSDRIHEGPAISGIPGTQTGVEHHRTPARCARPARMARATTNAKRTTPSSRG